MNKNKMMIMAGGLAGMLNVTGANASLITTINENGDSGGQYSASVYPDEIDFNLTSLEDVNTFLFPLASAEDLSKVNISMSGWQCSKSTNDFVCNTLGNQSYSSLSGTVTFNDLSLYEFIGFKNNREETSTVSLSGNSERFFTGAPIIKERSVNSPISEPGSKALLGLGLLGLAAFSRRKIQK